MAIRVLDINDNAPEFASEYEAFLCENGKPGQVRHYLSAIPGVGFHFRDTELNKRLKVKVKELILSF